MFIDPKCSEAINNMLSAIFDDHEFRQNISEILHATTKNSSK